MTIIIDSDTCTSCGICTAVCPLGIIQKTADSHPQVSPQYAGTCISCGQCEAFCPNQSLSNTDTQGIREKATVKGEISGDTLSRYIRSRRSIRNYLPDLVDKSTIEAILDTSRYAASGGNGQPVEWLVVYNPDKVREIAALTVEWMKSLMGSSHPMSGYVPGLISAWDQGMDVICRGAPHLVIPHIPEGNPMAITDGIIALTHVDIVSPSFGVGTCWAGFVFMAASQYHPLQRAIGLPEGRMISYAMMMGYPRFYPTTIPSRKPLKITWNE